MSTRFPKHLGFSITSSVSTVPDEIPKAPCTPAPGIRTMRLRDTSLITSKDIGKHSFLSSFKGGYTGKQGTEYRHCLYLQCLGGQGQEMAQYLPNLLSLHAGCLQMSGSEVKKVILIKAVGVTLSSLLGQKLKNSLSVILRRTAPSPFGSKSCPSQVLLMTNGDFFASSTSIPAQREQ